MTKTEQDNRIAAHAVARYLAKILTSVLGHDVTPDILISLKGSTLYREERQLKITLSLDDAKKLADVLNSDTFADIVRSELRMLTQRELMEAQGLHYGLTAPADLARVRVVDHDGNVRFITHRLLGRWSCVSASGTPLAFSYACVTKETELLLALQDARTAGDVLAAVKRFSSAPTVELMEAPALPPLAAKRQRIARVVDNRARCYHLADSATPGANLSADPCPRCGRYFVDDGDESARFVDAIFERVMAALQPAEEISGPEGAQYVALMERIAHEAQRRADRVREDIAKGTEH